MISAISVQQSLSIKNGTAVAAIQLQTTSKSELRAIFLLNLESLLSL